MSWEPGVAGSGDLVGFRDLRASNLYRSCYICIYYTTHAVQPTEVGNLQTGLFNKSLRV